MTKTSTRIADEEEGQQGREGITDVRARELRNRPDDMIILELLEETDFPDSCTWNTFVFRFQSNFLECHYPVRVDVSGLVNHAIGTYVDGGGELRKNIRDGGRET